MPGIGTARIVKSDNASRSDAGDPDYATLLAFREALRRFNRWTEDEAKAMGITPAQHQLLLCIRGNRTSGASRSAKGPRR
jgi:hypothetical protein